MIALHIRTLGVENVQPLIGNRFCILLKLVDSLGLQSVLSLQLQQAPIHLAICSRASPESRSLYQDSVLTPVTQCALHALAQHAAEPPRAYTLRNTFHTNYPPAPIH